MHVRPLPFVLAALAVFLGGAALVLVSVLGDETSPVVEVTQADPRRGKAAIERYGCTSCHVIPGIAAPEGEVGPSLAGLANRRTIAGDLPNTPDQLVRWIMDPQAVEPGTRMPDLGVTEPEATDIAAYLYSDP